MYIDAHCHLADPRFDAQRDDVLARARQAGVTRFIQGGVGPDDWDAQQHLQGGRFDLTFGLHPWWVAAHDDAACAAAFTQLQAKLDDALALGETGLDFFPKQGAESFDRQRRWFIRQLDLAVQQDKPVILHLVRAHGEAPALLRQHRIGRGMVHGFTGSYESAKGYLDLGLLISVGGAVARSGFRKLKSAVSRIPISRLVIESDAPDMLPGACAGPLNEPANIWEVARAVADLKQMEPQQVLAQSTANLTQEFGLEPWP